MAALKELAHVDEEYATSGPNHRMLVQRIEAPSASVFRCLEDGPAWKEWLGIDVTWTSERPFGVGTTRTVKAARQTIDECYLVWEPGERMNFRFERATLPVAAMAEDYRIVAQGESSCDVEWSYAFDWIAPLPALTQHVFAVGFALNAKRSLNKLATLMAESGTRFDPPE